MRGYAATWRPRAGFVTIRRSSLARNRAAVAGLVILVPLVVATLAPGLLTGLQPNAQDLSISLQPPGGEHFLGADKLGRGVWASSIYGAQPTLLGALVVILISGAIGIPLGLVAGYFGGRVDTLIMRLLDCLLAFPAIRFMCKKSKKGGKI